MGGEGTGHLVDDLTEAAQHQREGLLGRVLQHRDRTPADVLGLGPAQDLADPGVRVLQVRPGVAGGLHHPFGVEDVVLVDRARQVGVLDGRQGDLG